MNSKVKDILKTLKRCNDSIIKSVEKQWVNEDDIKEAAYNINSSLKELKKEIGNNGSN